MLEQRLNEATQPDLRLVASATSERRRATAPRRLRRKQAIADAFAICIGLTAAVASRWSSPSSG